MKSYATLAIAWLLTVCLYVSNQLAQATADEPAGTGSAEHWSFVRPEQPTLPTVRTRSWQRNAIDRFVLARLEQEGLRPASEADRHTLIRRVSLDLTGLPPTLEEVEAFLADSSPQAYEKVVDRLLASPRFGERMAMQWLDVARFADTDGYSGDQYRSMWLWRDWVIDALNRNLPFDQFTIEQLAGDLLPNATLAQQIATGFNRNHRINREPGSIPEEWRTEYVMDRVDTTSTVWLGLTMICARCHDHMYDPISQREFYELFAFFNNVDEVGNGGGEANAAPPIVRLASAEDDARLTELDSQLDTARQELEHLEKAPQTSDEPLKSARESVTAIQKERTALLTKIPTTMVMAERAEPRDTFFLERGQYSEPGNRVAIGVPEFLPPLSERAPKNRLGLAQWLVAPAQPLTARVTVNRYWQLYFGRGLVKTEEDFGAQGEAPTHPQLLDWLATEFVQSGWDVKQMHKLIVTSATYRQSSKSNATSRQTDPENRMLSYAPRLRLPAEIIRDQALAVSGLLVGTIGGPSVKPYQPDGVWDGVAYKVKYVPDRGEKLYRRSLYTYWKRTVPPPSMTTFDAPDRETCKTRRSRTNTPLQALLLMNETTYVEAARRLAQQMIQRGGASPSQRLGYGFRRVLARAPKPVEVEVLRHAYRRYLQIYRADRSAADRLTSIGESPRDGRLDVADLAAYTAVGSVLFNLDKTITRE